MSRTTRADPQDGQPARRRWLTATSHVRLVVMLFVGLCVAGVSGAAGAWGYAALAGWDAAALVFTAWVWLAIGPMSSSATSTHATREDPGQAATDLVVLIAATASLGAVGLVLIRASSAGSGQQSLIAGLCIISVVLSWFTIHTLFTLRYARLYYTGVGGGVNFHQDAPPCYLDFAYLAFTIGMTFQVSDTDLQSPPIRHMALRHALLSYLFGAVILATTINLVAGLGTNST
jgi:uncharacterized membrane protein